MLFVRPNNQHRFVESVPFDKQTKRIHHPHARPLQINDVIEIDTHQELCDLDVPEKESSRRKYS